ncbi:MAG: iron ABC transporter permease [Planctomycetota bacterium]
MKRAPGVARRLGLLSVALAAVALTYAIAGGEMLVDPMRLARGEGHDLAFFLDIRLPRLLTALLVGGGLGAAGAMVQGILRNDLVEPGILGLNSGAELGVILAVATYSGPAWASALLLPAAAWLGSLLAVGMVALLSWRRTGPLPVQILLAGLAVTMLLSALNAVLGLWLQPSLQAVAISWQAGTLGSASWEQLTTLIPVSVVLLPAAFLAAPVLNVLALGDHSARSLGVNVTRQRAWLIALAVALSSSCVAAGGGIAFVGLIAPHVVRRLVGANYRAVLPAAAIAGAILLLAADLLARTLFLPSLMPTGIILAVLGVPYFLLLLMRT